MEVEAGYKNLKVYKLSFELALEVHKLSLSFPKIEQFALGDQMRRASKGICANIAEGQAKQYYSKAEFRRFTLMALGSSQEMRVWLEFAYELNYIDQHKFNEIDHKYLSTVKMLSSLAQSQQA